MNNHKKGREYMSYFLINFVYITYTTFKHGQKRPYSPNIYFKEIAYHTHDVMMHDAMMHDIMMHDVTMHDVTMHDAMMHGAEQNVCEY